MTATPERREMAAASWLDPLHRFDPVEMRVVAQDLVDPDAPHVRHTKRVFEIEGRVLGIEVERLNV